MSALSNIPRFIEIIAAGASRSSTPAINSGSGNTIFAVKTENVTPTNDAEFESVQNNQQVRIKNNNRIEVQVPDTNALSNTHIANGTMAKIVLHGAVGAQGIELDNIIVAGVRKSDAPRQYILVSAQCDNINDAFSYFTSV